MAVQTSTTTMQVHDELAALLARNLTLNPSAAVVPRPADQQPKITYSISQHYHHSAHVKPVSVSSPVEQQQQQQQQHQQQEQQQQQQQQHQQLALQQSFPPAEQQEMATLLLQHGIDASALSPVQIALFRMSTPDRREYLLQLWRICCPVAQQGSTGPSQNMADMMAMSLDGTAVHVAAQQQPSSTAVQGPDGRWLQTASQNYMEPYMSSGYEELARREYMASAAGSAGSLDSAPERAGKDAPSQFQRATDPVYNNRLATPVVASHRASWPTAAMQMENQYGALMAVREGSEMEL